jgi:hypothetical protein
MEIEGRQDIIPGFEGNDKMDIWHGVRGGRRRLHSFRDDVPALVRVGIDPKPISHQQFCGARTLSPPGLKWGLLLSIPCWNLASNL